MGRDARSVVMEFLENFTHENEGQTAFLDHTPCRDQPAFWSDGWEIDQVEVEDDIVSVLVTRSGTDPTTGKVFRGQVLEMFRVEGGRIVERWGFRDEPPSVDLRAQRPAKMAST